jgi:multidrug resistance efflux pump
MPEQIDFVDRIIEGFQSLKDRPAYRLLAGQFEAGELTFIVDRQGIRIHLDTVEVEAEGVDNTLEGLD